MDRPVRDNERERSCRVPSPRSPKPLANGVVHRIDGYSFHVLAVENTFQLPYVQPGSAQNDCAIRPNQEINLIAGLKLEVVSNFLWDCRLTFTGYGGRRHGCSPLPCPLFLTLM